MPVTTEVDTHVLDAILRNLNGNVAQKIAKIAFTIETKAKLKIPVDTGAARASIYTELKDGSKFDAVMGEATALAAKKRVMTSKNFVRLPAPKNNHEAYVGPSVEYGASLELGDSRHAARPYLAPAVQEAADEFRQGMAEAITNR